MERLHGGSNVPASQLIGEFGMICQEQGDLVSARRYLEKALKIKEACYRNKINADTAASLTALGRLLI